MKRRAKSGLIRVKVDWKEAKEFITQHLGKEIKVSPFSYFLAAAVALGTSYLFLRVVES